MEPRFITKLIFEDDGGLPFIVRVPLTYVTDVEHYGTFTVPENFKTDLASIPRGLWNVLPQVGRYDAAAVLHDYLYQQPPNAPKKSRSFADSVLYEAMGVLGVSAWQRWTIYLGVRVGGWKVWNKYRAEVWAPHGKGSDG